MNLRVSLVLLVAGCSTAVKSAATLHVERVAPGLDPLAQIEGDIVGDRDHHVERVGADNVVRWRSDVAGQWLMPRGAGDALVVTEHDEHYKQTIVRVHLRDGSIAGRAQVDWKIGSWNRGGDALYVVDSTQVERIDPDAGAIRWSARGTFDQYTAMPGPHGIWIPCGARLCGFAEDGTTLGPLDGAGWPHIIPDGDHRRGRRAEHRRARHRDPARGVAPAVPSAAPEIDGDLVVVDDFGTRVAYRVTR